MASELDLPPSWVAITDPAQQAGFAAELRREIIPEHVLAKENVNAIARWHPRDDFLFALDDGRVAAVHLTWSVETSPDWPATNIYASFEEWRQVPDEDR